MSSRGLEDKNEREFRAKVASTLELSVTELDELDPDIEEYEISEAVPYGYNVYFLKESNPAILAKVAGLIDGRWVRIGPII